MGGTDAASFTIDSTTGQLRTSAALDYETKNTYSVTVTVSDGNLTNTIRVTIDVTDVNEVPTTDDPVPPEDTTPENSAPVFIEGNSTTRSVTENTASGTNIGTAISATDVDGDTLTYSLGGTDAAVFSIVSTTGQLQTKAALDYETKSSYSVTVTVSDGNGGSDSIPVTIDVRGERAQQGTNSAPVFTEGDSTTRTVAENTDAGTNIGAAISATDADNAHTLIYSFYSLDSDTDASSFDIDSATGQLRTKAALDYETKNTYSVTVSVSDDSDNNAYINVTINVTDANDAPVFTDGTSTTRSIEENTDANTNIGATITATDADNDTLTYSLSGTDSGSFSIVSTSGQLRTKAALDYETKDTYSVTVSVSDGNGGTDTINVTINVTDVNYAPVFTEGTSTTRSIEENTDTNTNIGTAILATDADKDTLTYSLSGTDAASFSIVSTSGQLQTKAALDYETDTSHTVTVSVSDGKGGTDSITVTINVTDVFEPTTYNNGDTIATLPTGSWEPDLLIGAAALTNSNNEYVIAINTNGKIEEGGYTYTCVTSGSCLITDGRVTKGTIEETLSVEPPSNNAPVFSEGASTTRSIADNAASGTNIGDAVAATDVDEGDTLVYSLTGTDASSFSIVSSSGQLQTKVALEHKTKSSYSVTVYVYDKSSAFDSIDVTINVTDVDENVIPAISARTPQVRDAIVAAAPVESANDVTLAHLAAITSLGLNNKSVSSLKTGDFNGLTALRTLSLNNNSISDISVLKDLTSLTFLQLNNNSISDISALSNLTSLATLVLDSNSISDISALSNLTSLGTLTLISNSISDISALTNLTKLTTLSLGSNSISNISALTNLTKLTTLSLSSNSISDISALSNLTSLVTLQLDNNSISDISALSNLTKLGTLTLNINSISDISVLSSLTKLSRLVLNSNSISNVFVLAGLTSLTYLSLEGNPISDYGPLDSLKTAKPSIDIDINLNNNIPTFTDGDSTTRSVAENTASDTNFGTAISATDADSGDTLTYSLGGTDAASFSIVSTSGQLQTKAALDYETETSYTVTVSVYDGNSAGDSITVTINVTDVQGAAPSLEISSVIPENTALLSNFPNPFNPETWIPYQLGKSAEATITIYDIRGRVVRVLVLGHQAAGVYRSRSKAAHWDGKNEFGEKVATGVYFYRLTAGDFSATRKMLIRK